MITKKDVKKYRMHDDNVKLITGNKADLYVFTIDQLNEFINNLPIRPIRDEQKALKIIKAIHDYVYESNIDVVISRDRQICITKDWDENTLTIHTENNHVHLGVIGQGNSFSRLIEDMYNFFL
jgi:hypothetical protein